MKHIKSLVAGLAAVAVSATTFAQIAPAHAVPVEPVNSFSTPSWSDLVVGAWAQENSAAKIGVHVRKGDERGWLTSFDFEHEGVTYKLQRPEYQAVELPEVTPDGTIIGVLDATSLRDRTGHGGLYFGQSMMTATGPDGEPFGDLMGHHPLTGEPVLGVTPTIHMDLAFTPSGWVGAFMIEAGEYFSDDLTFAFDSAVPAHGIPGPYVAPGYESTNPPVVSPPVVTPPVVDRKVTGLKVAAKKEQRRVVKVRVRAGERVALKTSATVKIKGRKALRLKTVHTSTKAGARKVIKMKASKRATRIVRKAHKRTGARAVVTVRVHATDAAGNTKVRKVKVRLVL